MAVKENYSKELVEQITAMYANGDSVEQIAEVAGKTKRSIISKLVRENVYIAPAKPAPKAKDEGPTKKEILRDIEATGFDVEGLEPATKDALARVLRVAQSVAQLQQAA